MALNVQLFSFAILAVVATAVVGNASGQESTKPGEAVVSTAATHPTDDEPSRHDKPCQTDKECQEKERERAIERAQKQRDEHICGTRICASWEGSECTKWRIGCAHDDDKPEH
jgi:hypothetical protein